MEDCQNNPKLIIDTPFVSCYTFYTSAMKQKSGRGVAVNMPPCQGGDRGFESRRSRSSIKRKLTNKWAFLILLHRETCTI
jgi:capsular polysaccharide biosynthesis protein